MFAEVCDFRVLREQILQLGEIGFFCWELIFVISESSRPVIVNIFLFIKLCAMEMHTVKKVSNNAMVCVPYTVCKTSVTDDFSLSFDYSNIWDD